MKTVSKHDSTLKQRHSAMKRILLIALSGLLLLAGSPTSAPAGTPDSPIISGIRMAGDEVLVRVIVPAGIRKVTLESRQRLGTGTWKPRAVQRLSGNAEEILEFRLPAGVDLELLRVRADAEDTLPAEFFAGESDFNGPASYYSNDPGDLRYYAPPESGLGGGDDGNTVEVVESDIWKIRGDTLYFFNQYRGLQIIDIADPDAPVVTGSLNLPASGEQMYVPDDGHVILLSRNYCGYGVNEENDVVIVGLAEGPPEILHTFPVAGYITESRMVGNVLIVASQFYRQIEADDQPTYEYGTAINSFDLTIPEQPVARTSLWYPGYNNAVTATPDYFFVVLRGDRWEAPSVIQCIDIASPDGTMFEKARIRAAGRVEDKFKMQLTGDVFSVISEAYVTTSSNPEQPVPTWVARLENFSMVNPDRPEKIGSVSMGWGERLFATRFDGDRAYVVTFERIDPLWIIDNSDPTRPEIRGELEIPGWSTFIYPMGSRLVTIGIDNLDGWRAAVQLFDVEDPAAPQLIGKVPLGENNSWSEANWDEKAFTVLPEDELILVPFQEYTPEGGASQVQLIDLFEDSLVKRGVINHAMQPRRATMVADRILSISGRELLTVDASDRDTPTLTARLDLSWPVDRVLLSGRHLLEFSNPDGWMESGSASLFVVDVDEPEVILNHVELEAGWRVQGADIRNDRLYLLLGPASYGYWDPWLMLEDVAATDGETPGPQPNFRLDVYDLSALPALERLGSHEHIHKDPGYYSSFKALWPDEGLLVWSGNSSYYGGWYYGGPMRLAVDFWPGGWGGGNGRLLAYDTSTANPALLSDLTLAYSEDQPRWDFSEAFATDGLIYLSHQESRFIPNATIPGVEPPPLPQTNPDAADGSDAETEPPTAGVWVQRFFLDVVDYADPGDPTVRDPVNLPGSLIGLSHGGAIVYTRGFRYDDRWETDWQTYITACAYDGVEAMRVDALPLPTNEWPVTTLLHQGVIFLGLPERVADDTARTAGAPPRLEQWTLGLEAKFVRLGTTELKQPATELRAFDDGLFVIRNYQDLALYSWEEPHILRPLDSAGAGSTCFWFDLSKADGSLDQGLWLPLNSYGLAHHGVDVSE